MEPVRWVIDVGCVQGRKHCIEDPAISPCRKVDVRSLASWPNALHISPDVRGVYARELSLRLRVKLAENCRNRDAWEMYLSEGSANVEHQRVFGFTHLRREHSRLNLSATIAFRGHIIAILSWSPVVL